jgi:dihydroneopterin aldolase
MTDKVFIEGLELYCIIGVHDWERHTLQKIRIDLEFETDCRTAGASDDVGEALDYRLAAKTAQTVVEGSSFLLVEALAERIAAALLDRFPQATRVRVRLGKPGAVRWAETVGVDISRGRKAGDA